MSTPVRVAAFVTALALVFVAAWGTGRLAEDRVEVEAATDGHSSAADDSAAGDGHADEGGHGDEDPADVGTAAAHQPGGLMVSQEGYTLDLRRPEDRTGVPGRVSFAITGPDGEAVTDFDVEHEKRLHLIVVRRDVAGFQHVHPTMAADGTWSVPVDLSPGTWRLLADFTPTGGPALTLGTDLQVAGDFAPRPEPPVTRSVAVDDYVVTLAGDLEPGEESTVTATVQRRGRPVSHLDPYLGAAGHLVALREGDLAYLHVHPEDGPPGPEVGFAVEVPSEGRYRLFLDFSHGGIVRTAAFTLATSGHPSTPEGDDHGHD